MKQVFTLFLIVLHCYGFSQSQAEMNAEATAAYKTANNELRDVFQQILLTYKSDTIFIQQLKKSQNLWVAFRESELDLRFPAPNKSAEYGSMYSFCSATLLTKIIQQRTKNLRIWLDGIPEGDVCSGSVKMK